MNQINTERAAVCVRDIHFSYFKCEPILRGINLTVNKRTIYGLLGSSGCGKTTLLKCILGRLKQNSGEIHIFGSKPGSPQCNIPGPGVGYMPQDIGLYTEFTIEEILTYFGRIYSMTTIEIKEKLNKLTKLLDLSGKNKFINKLSGGQQRRVSLACALIHSPPLLILDEPTVGTDPVLRNNIWLHLVSLCKSGHTVILTTHYIEETRDANTVGFMRNGRTLIEENPMVLLTKYISTNLEEVFLKLCHLEDDINDRDQSHCHQNGVIVSVAEQNDGMNPILNKTLDTIDHLNNFDRMIFKKNNHILGNRRGPKIVEDNSVNCVSIIRREDSIENKQTFISDLNNNILVSIRNSRFIDKCSALLHKNYKRITRKWGHLIFELMFSSLIFIITLMSAGDGPKNLRIAICNQELNNNLSDGWGQRFIDNINKERFVCNYFESSEEAIDSVKSGESNAAIVINESFTKDLIYLHLSQTQDKTLQGSQIYVHMDWSNQLVALQIQKSLHEAMMNFITETANKLRLNPESFKLLAFKDPVYGNTKNNLRQYLLPGLYLALTFYTTATITAHMLIEERREGLLDRSLVAGITFSEFFISNLFTQFSILCFQILFLLLLPYILFSLQIRGLSVLCVSLILSQGLCGVAFGLFVSVITSEMMVAALIVLWAFLSAMTTSGVIWPIENMSYVPQVICKLMPNTLPAQSMRSILYREWTIDYYEVYIGFVVTYVWFAIFLIITLVLLKRIL